MINNFSYYQPVGIEFGAGKIKELSKIVNDNDFTRGVLICDKLFVSNGTADKITSVCPALTAVYSDITPNPTLSEVTAAAKLLKAENADFAVALGGGSSLDLAKFACSQVFADFPAAEYFYKRQTFSEKHIPLIAVPTTAGTGSEVTAVSVCNDEVTGVKSPLRCENFFPKVALIDSELTFSVPPFVTAATGLDAMSHAFEGFWSVKHQPICDAYAAAALKFIFDNLEKAYLNGKDSEARNNMSLAANLAGLAFALTGTAAVHAMSYPLSQNYHLCHGEACAFTLDAFIRINAKADARVESLAKELGFASADDCADEVIRLKKVFGLKTSLNDCGISDVYALSSECAAHPLYQNNPAKLTAKQLEKELQKL